MTHNEMDRLVDKAIKDNPKDVVKYHNGNRGAANYIMGQVMKYSKGQADPTVVYDMIMNKI